MDFHFLAGHEKEASRALCLTVTDVATISFFLFFFSFSFSLSFFFKPADSGSHEVFRAQWGRDLGRASQSLAVALGKDLDRAEASEVPKTQGLSDFCTQGHMGSVPAKEASLKTEYC